MNFTKRINAFATLGNEFLSSLQADSKSPLALCINSAQAHNPWFTSENVKLATEAIATKWLGIGTLNKWIQNYDSSQFNPKVPKTVGVVMAGNIPLVGFHDFMCVLLSGHRIVGKVSSKDGGLMKAVSKMLISIEPEFEDFIEITDERLTNFDAVIATGSDNSSRYFDYYFRKYPSIIRGHRNSIAVLTGKESENDLMLLGNDIFSYFGLGCRNVSKLLVPKGYEFTRFFEITEKWSHLIRHHRYANNYEYHRALFIINGTQHFDNGFLLVTKSDSIDSSVGVLNYQEYDSVDSVKEYINLNASKIQCVVSMSPMAGAVPFGQTQLPGIDEYADGIDTINFLANL
ncbi:MAG TPA: acyl-CoA reductase [Tenuifilaceae bacterium]|nr:acyl-CoA reductase [Tenuifilaceae bacterium]HRX31358.1 acyl-CoA reductase [Tenuifilaceae bacterium]